MRSPEKDRWIKADSKEFSNFVEKGVVKIADLPAGFRAIPTMMVYALKKDDQGEFQYDVDGSLLGQKARLVADGSQQDESQWSDNFAATAHMETLRLALGYAAEEMSKDWTNISFRTADFKGAFLNAPIDCEMYTSIPKSSDPTLEEARLAGKVWRIKKAIYGLVQSANLWAEMLRELLEDIGYVRMEGDWGLYVLREGDSFCMIPTHVDDLLGVMNDVSLWERTIEELKKHVTFSKDGLLSFHLGAKYTVDLVNKSIISLVGKLGWLAGLSRPDICHAVRQLQQFVSKPTEEHWVAAKRVLRYLAGTITYSVIFIHNGLGLVGFSDADWAGCPMTHLSRTGNLVWFNGPISWTSELQGDHALSSCESKYYAVGRLGKSIVGTLALALESGIVGPDALPLPLFSDNTAAIALAKNPHLSKATGHIALRHHWIRSKITDRTLSLTHLGTNAMPADIFTKALGVEKFELGRELIRVVEGGRLPSNGGVEVRG
ncbi:hypothetical protein RQP46_010866 [Phenoliferia psychrophenolica]